MHSYSLDNGILRANIKAEGAELTSLCLRGREYIWQADPLYWGRHAPILFPIVGSLRNNQAFSYRGPVMLPRHGFARDKTFELLEHTKHTLVLRISSTQETKVIYPFDYELSLSYELEDTSLKQSFKVYNPNPEYELYCFLGAHPAFNVPLCESENFSDYRLSFSEAFTASTPSISADGLINSSERSILFEHKRELALNHALFERDTLLFEDLPKPYVRLEGSCGHGVELQFSDFPYFAVWSVADAPFIALEPWCGSATQSCESDCFEHKRGCLCVPPKESITKRLYITPF